MIEHVHDAGISQPGSVSDFHQFFQFIINVSTMEDDIEPGQLVLPELRHAKV
jgi:hypothetical protein